MNSDPLQAYNTYPAIDYVPSMPSSAYFGPQDRFQILSDLFGMDVARVEKNLCVEPPFWCDYGVNIEFKGEVSPLFRA